VIMATLPAIRLVFINPNAYSSQSAPTYGPFDGPAILRILGMSSNMPASVIGSLSSLLKPLWFLRFAEVIFGIINLEL
jgi:hypothetical protein